ncbi:membrane fusion protein [Vibrio ishigakensis]|uniref:Membrane fusion protein n=2 Tax=Vibrio ishigakensis TaxID=1481914 RepID=A0A0B8NLG6_9VIBR|nr:biotin/lipoyl-binding protein [Vibrio ishigakensis]GAM54916.1 membrane fusion protein [Vibrio ishigakensis]
MLEGLAVWALFIYLLRLVGMPWNAATKSFAYLGGGAWLMFVWVGLINYTPMDISGGSVVQSPHIQLRPASAGINGKVEHIYIEPNQDITQGQLIYELEKTPYEIALDKAKTSKKNAEIAVEKANDEIAIAEATHATLEMQMKVAYSELTAAQVDYELETKTLHRFVTQNRVVKNSISQSDIDKQTSLVELSKQKIVTIQADIATQEVEVQKAYLEIGQAELNYQSKQSELLAAEGDIKQAQWNLDATKVHAPADGFVTNFILREGQLVSLAPRIQMYTDEKYVLMRVNHQAIRNVKKGMTAEFASAVYPGKIFSAEVEGIVEATGESQGNLFGVDQSVRSVTGQNVMNKHHFVRLRIEEPEGYDIPVGSVGLAWVSGEKPNSFLNFLDVIRGIIIRMKSQLYFFYSV